MVTSPSFVPDGTTQAGAAESGGRSKARSGGAVRIAQPLRIEGAPAMVGPGAAVLASPAMEDRPTAEPASGSVPPDEPSEETVAEVYDKIADLLMVLSDVASGDFTNRVDSGFPETHPLGALCVGINEMIEALRAEQQRNERYKRELEEKLHTIEQQRSAIRELSTPIMEVWEGILCLPIVGIMDSTRSADMTDALLRAVVATRATATIIDITGIEVMDTHTADHFIRMAKAVRLLGAECVLTGINPQIAQTVIHMGLEMVDVVSHRSLRDALQTFISRRQTAAPKLRAVRR
jgi:rsbT co-antagonist protein RsbR